jgi:hypothetical protein
MSRAKTGFLPDSGSVISPVWEVRLAAIPNCALTDKNLLFAAPLVLGAARVRENWFLVSLIMAA